MSNPELVNLIPSYSVASSSASHWSNAVSAESGILARLLDGTPTTVSIVGFNELPDEVSVLDLDAIGRRLHFWYEDDSFFYRGGVSIRKDTLSAESLCRRNMTEENKVSVEHWAACRALERENHYLRRMITKLIYSAQGAGRVFRELVRRVRGLPPLEFLPEVYTFRPGAHAGTLKIQTDELLRAVRDDRVTADRIGRTGIPMN